MAEKAAAPGPFRFQWANSMTTLNAFLEKNQNSATPAMALVTLSVISVMEKQRHTVTNALHAMEKGSYDPKKCYQ